MTISNVVNIVSDTSSVNMGVWKAALVGHETLKKNGIVTWLFVATPMENIPEGVGAFFTEDIEAVRAVMKEQGLGPSNTLVVTHGCWLAPTRLGRQLASEGHPWIYVPQGMLEPWSLRQSRLKKLAYFHLLEKRLARQATAIRAVSGNEAKNFARLFAQRIHVIGNGVKMPSVTARPEQPVTFLFMARLHQKKGIVPLVTAWKQTMSNSTARLVICGSDEGELEKIRNMIGGNVAYRGMVTGADKSELLHESHYFALPSHSEGLPSGVLEAMSYGLIPIISDGCNLPEVFDLSLGYRVESEANSIGKVLKELDTRKFDTEQSQRNIRFIAENYSEEKIGEKLLQLYSQPDR